MARPTMAHIAAATGVSVATVSRALNQATADSLRPETVSRIRRAADELGYEVNLVARGLRRQRSATLGMLVPDLTNPFMPPVVRAIENALGASDYTLVVSNTDNDPARERVVIRAMLARQVEGLLLATARLDPDWRPATPPDLPVVLINRGSGLPLPSVVPDDTGGVERVVAHLLELGHRRLGHVAGPPEISTGRNRARAFLAVTAASGVASPADVETTRRLTVDEGHRAAGALLRRRPDLTALVAANDLVAVGCLRALRELGRRVPDDVSLTGFNDMQFVDLLDPPLTTVRIDHERLGSVAANVLLAQLTARDATSVAEGVTSADQDGTSADQDATPTAVHTVETHLLVRASTAAPPAVP
ncbi:LacI family DNA-binding transcriptional regulator [Egicoccus sp. AB-alg6-2]|uniref:LacI family DNA-binding transcriptional regulator n=1 Tax=Egicoccus sp. AB-alg6-2 TaxID=3242692 RepID=UPI00359D2710